MSDSKWIQRPSEFLFPVHFCCCFAFFSLVETHVLYSLLSSSPPLLTLHLNCIYELNAKGYGGSRSPRSLYSVALFFFFMLCIPAFMIYSVVYWPHSLLRQAADPLLPTVVTFLSRSGALEGVFFRSPQWPCFSPSSGPRKINQKTSVFVMVEDNQFPMRRREKDRNQKKGKEIRRKKARKR